MAGKKVNKLNFEDAVERLGAIAAEMETSGLSDCVKLYEEGVRLALLCRDEMEKAEETVFVLREKLGGA